MAGPFVPVSLPVDWNGGCMSSRVSPMHTSNCRPSTLEGVPWVRHVAPRGAAATPEECRNKPRGGVLDGSPILQNAEIVNDSWMERPATPLLLSYEIMEERSKFTVYKILVTGSEGDCWVIFRRYADFSRLNDKLKELFPSLRVALPAKRWFKDNYDMEFLEERQVGLKTFLQNLTVHKEVISSEAVRHFLCLDDPPNPFDSLEESRAFCETLEETNHRLQRELMEKQRDVDSLKKTLEDTESSIGLLKKKVKALSLWDDCDPTAVTATDINTHRGEDADVKEEEQKRSDGNGEEEDAGRGCFAPEPETEPTRGTRSWSLLEHAGHE
ncbi:sorting nexin-16-like isoform X2 [Genypterus blacodes]|uniref:sorting nexin-16-like isoform X2 n=1 Tax=Genypterus blacodes TaxID=154954 RepID=UPI003F762CC1